MGRRIVGSRNPWVFRDFRLISVSYYLDIYFRHLNENFLLRNEIQLVTPGETREIANASEGKSQDKVVDVSGFACLGGQTQNQTRSKELFVFETGTIADLQFFPHYAIDVYNVHSRTAQMVNPYTDVINLRGLLLLSREI